MSTCGARFRAHHAWAERCLAAKTRPDQALFGIVQGGVPRLARGHARFLIDLDLPGYAVGGWRWARRAGDARGAGWLHPLLPGTSRAT